MSAPALPQLPQPQQTQTPTAPPAPPSLDEIFNTPKSNLRNTAEGAATDIGGLADQFAQEPGFRTAQETQYDIAGKKQTVTDLTNRLNTLKASADQIPLQIQN